MRTIKLLSWNVNGRVRESQRRQLSAVLARAPDVVALQELTAGSHDGWARGLEEAGYSVLSNLELLASPYPPPPYPAPPFPSWEEPHDQIQRKYFNLIAARHPIELLPGLSFDDPDEGRFAFPEKHISARVEIDGHQVDVHNTHLPPGVSRGVVKVHAFEAIRRRVDLEPDRLRVLCGDFNAPGDEDEDGPLMGCGPDWPDEIRARWDRADAGVLTNPEMRDVYRDVHEPGRPFPVSHFTGWGGRRTPRRYDYIFASADLTTEECVYLTDWLEPPPDERPLSDHAPVEARLAIAG